MRDSGIPSQSTDLFGATLSSSNLPHLKDGETLYSWCSRYHLLSCNSSPHVTSYQLFRDRLAGLRHDIPFALSAFEAQTQGAVGSANDLLYQRTVFGFYARFLPAALKERIAGYFLASENAKARALLGLSRAGRSIIAPLKYCPECASMQQQQHQYAWWQTDAQFPTSYVCILHGVTLNTLAASYYRGTIQDYFLPHFSGNSNADTQCDQESTERLNAITTWGIYLIREHKSVLTDELLRWCYRLQAKVRGFVAFDGSVRLQALRDGFVRHYGKVFEHLGEEGLGDLATDNAGFLAYLFRKAPSRRHPSKHVILLSYLFESFSEFEHMLANVRSLLESQGPQGCEALLRNQQNTLIELVNKLGLSLNQAAPLVGTSVSVAAKFIDKAGSIQRERRPHIVGTEKEYLMRRLLDEGMPRAEIAREVGIRRGFIKDYFANHPDQKVRWEEAHLARQRTAHRTQFATLLDANPGLSIKAIRLLPKNGFQWLYNNDREWLREILPAIWKR